MLSYKKKYIDILSKLLVLFVLGFIGETFAQGIVETGGSGIIKNIFNITGGGNLLSIVGNTLKDGIDFVRLVLNGVALLAMLYVGFLWVTSMGNEERTADGKNRIMLVLLGLFIINIPDVIYRIITGSEYNQRGFRDKIAGNAGRIGTGTVNPNISDESTRLCNYFFCPRNFFGAADGTSVIQFLELTMIVVAVIMFTWGGFMMFFGSGSEENSDTAKRRLGYGTIVLLITGFVEMIYRAVFFQPKSDEEGPIEAITTALMTGAKFFLYFAGPIAIIYIIIGGYYYITSGGDEERTDKGKRILMYTAFATVMLILGYTFLIEIIGLNIF